MVIKKAQFCDLEEILSLQKLAFQSEAKLFNDYSIAPLTQSLESIVEDFKNNMYLKAVYDGKIIGSVRAFEKKIFVKSADYLYIQTTKIRELVNY